MGLINLVLYAAGISAILIILHKTDVIFEYIKLFPLPKSWRFYLLMSGYESNRWNYKNYLYYLNEKWSQRPISGFFLRLILCPYCLAFWLAVTSLSKYFLAIYVFSLIFYFTLEHLSDKRK